MAVLLQAVIVLLWATMAIQAACPPPIDGRWNRGSEHRWVKNEGWSAVDGRCLATVRAFPNQCDDVCISNGGRWATVQSQAQNDWFLARGKELNENIWIGLTDHAVEGTYQWTNPGDSVTYTNWGPGEPANEDAKQCAFMWNIQDFQWRAASCIAGQVYCGCVTDDLLSPTRAQPRSEIGFECVSETVGESALTSEPPCPAGWESRFGKCYLATPEKKNYPTCMAHCTSLNATLPCVTNARESMYLVGLYPGDFSPGEPNNYHDEDCVSVCLRGVTMWNDLPCSFETYCVCEKSENTCAAVAAPPPVAAVPPPAPEISVSITVPTIVPTCPAGWESKFGKCYLTTLPKQNYTSCLSTCTALEATLPCVMSAEESLYLVDLSKGRNDCAFLGLNDIVTEGKFVWQEGCFSTFTNFLPGEPNNYYDEEDCVNVCMVGTTKWNDIPCRLEMRCVCEKGAGTVEGNAAPVVLPRAPQPEAAVPVIVPAAVDGCPAGWESRFGKCYLTTNPKMDYPTCLSHCADLEASLPCVMNTEENTYLSTLPSTRDPALWGTYLSRNLMLCSSWYSKYSLTHMNDCLTVSNDWKGDWRSIPCIVYATCVCEKKADYAPAEALTVPEPAVVPTTGSTTPQHQCTCGDCAALYSASKPQAAHECSFYCYNNC